MTKFFWREGSCFENCAAGEVTSGGAIIEYNEILHGQTATIQCSEEYVGVVSISCNDGIKSLHVNWFFMHWT